MIIVFCLVQHDSKVKKVDSETEPIAFGIHFELRMTQREQTDFQSFFHSRISKKSNLPYTRSSTPKRVTSGGAHLRGFAPG